MDDQINRTEFSTSIPTCYPTKEEKLEYALRFIHVLRLFGGFIPLPLSIIELLITLLFILVLMKAIRHKKVSRKCYLLILNRSLGDLIVSGTCLACNIATILETQPARRSEVILGQIKIIYYLAFARTTLFYISIGSSMISYILLSALKIFAIFRPLLYLRMATLKKIGMIVALSWVFLFGFLALQISRLLRISLVISLNQKHNIGNDIRRRRGNDGIVLLLYLLTIAAFLLTVFVIKRAERFHDPTRRLSIVHYNNNNNVMESDPMVQRSPHSVQHLPKHPRFSLAKLSLNVITFTCFNLLYFAVELFIFAMVAGTDCTARGRGPTAVAWLAMSWNLQSLRIILDPILSFATDTQLRQTLLDFANYFQKSPPHQQTTFLPNSNDHYSSK